MKNPLRRRLRMRFVLISMAALVLLQSAIVSVCIYQNYRDMIQKSDAILSQLYEKPSENVRYFSVKAHPGKGTIRLDTVQHVSVTPEQAGSYARTALQNGQDKGFAGEYRYHILRSSEGTRIIFLSRSASLEMHKTAAHNILQISAGGLLAVFLALIPVSGWAVRPIVENHLKQKQFITVAGHELKTPLTVISTNAQLLQAEIGDNRWLDGILQQTDDLVRLTQDLVTLYKAEEFDSTLNRSIFSVSDAVRNEIEPFDGYIAQKSIRLEVTVPTGISYNGCETEIRHLIRVLLDNALKYCPEGGTVRIGLKRELWGIRLCMRNTTQYLGADDAASAAQRFYRGQNAAGKDGFGLGLSIAKTIAGRHNGNLTVSLPKEDAFLVEVTLR